MGDKSNNMCYNATMKIVTKFIRRVFNGTNIKTDTGSNRI
jgi:hypothetical protein